MKSIYYHILEFLRSITHKIAFYPTVFALLGVLAAALLIYLESLGISAYLLDNFPLLVVDNGNTALTILSALITGLISMMVFSFSMVMLLLNQASSNYSPRLLPGLISDKSHQIILGIYLGTILYCIFVLTSIQPTGNEYQIPGFSVLIGIFFTVVSIYAFIFFIHNISQSIQISKILDRIYIVAKNKLSHIIKNELETDPDFPSSDSWFEYHTEKSGYLQTVTISNIVDVCEKEDTMIHILPVEGIFVLKGIPLFKSRKELKKETVDRILGNFTFSRGELVSDNYVLAFKQITEIIVKAMSPGINDPGTALNGIDYLSELFSLRLQKKENNIISRERIPYIKINTVHFDELLYNVMASIRAYCKHDIILIQKLMLMFQYLRMQTKDPLYLKIIDREARTLLEDAKNSLSNPRDYEEAVKVGRAMGLDFVQQKNIKF